MRTKSEIRRQAIIDTATEVFSEVGFDNASMAAITQRLGGSKATLYSYFGSKEELFAATMLKISGCLFMPIFSELNPDVDLTECLTRFGRRLLPAVFSPQIVALRRMVQDMGQRSEIGRILYEQGPKRGWGRVASLFDELVQRGVLRPCDTWVAAHHFKALLESEWMDKVMLGVVPTVDEAELNSSVDRAVAVFMMAYAQPHAAADAR